MSVFDFDGQTEDENTSLGDSGAESNVKSVSVVETTNGGGYTSKRVTLPADFARDMDVEGGDVVLMHHDEGSNTIEVKKP